MFEVEIVKFDDLLDKADVCTDQLNFSQAIEYYLHAVDVFLPHCSKPEFPLDQLLKFFKITEHLGAIFKLRGQYLAALNYYSLAKKHCKKINTDDNLIRINNAIQDIYDKLELVAVTKLPNINHPVKIEKKPSSISTRSSLPSIYANNCSSKLNFSLEVSRTKHMEKPRTKTNFNEPPDRSVSLEDDPALHVLKDQINFLNNFRSQR